MDLDDARYRRVSNSSDITKMCDFSVALADSTSASYIAIELKSREPYFDEVKEQLQQGLEVIMTHLVDGPAKLRLRAILVVGIKSSRLLRLANSPEGRLSAGRNTIPIEVVDCDSELLL